MPSSFCHRRCSFKGLDISNAILFEFPRDSHQDFDCDRHIDAGTYDSRFYQHRLKHYHRGKRLLFVLLKYIANATHQTTSITSTVTTLTVSTTATTYSIDGSNQKRGLATGIHIPNPVESDGLNKRTLTKSTPKIPPCLTAFASGIISSACACLNIPTPTQVRCIAAFGAHLLFPESFL